MEGSERRGGENGKERRRHGKVERAREKRASQTSLQYLQLCNMYFSTSYLLHLGFYPTSDASPQNMVLYNTTYSTICVTPQYTLLHNIWFYTMYVSSEHPILDAIWWYTLI